MQAAAPAKTDADIARSAEEMRRRMALSTNGFAADFKTGKLGDSAAGPNLQAVTLGA